MNALFWSVEAVIAAAVALFMINAYRLQTLQTESATSTSLERIAYACFDISELVSVILVIDAYRRLNKCLENDKL